MSRMNLNSPVSTTTIAVAADYADAMMTARRAKNWLFILLLLVLLTQLSLFFLLKFNVLHLGDEVAVEASPTSLPASTQAADASTQPAIPAATVVSTEGRSSKTVEDILRYVIPGSTFLGTTMVVVLGVVLLLIVTIMLVGRLIGVSHVTSAFVWCIVLAILMFPWQTILIGQRADPKRTAAGVEGTSSLAADAGVQRDPTFKIPGALYTWEELSYDIRHFPQGASLHSVLKWARYAGFPVVALLLLLMLQAKSSRGLKFALGESEVKVEVSQAGV